MPGDMDDWSRLARSSGSSMGPVGLSPWGISSGLDLPTGPLGRPNGGF